MDLLTSHYAELFSLAAPFLLIPIIFFSFSNKNKKRGLVVVYRDKITTQGIGGEYMSDVICVWIFTFTPCFIFMLYPWPSTEALIFTALICSIAFAITYRLWSKSYIIDFKAGKVSKNFLFFKLPLEELQDFGGIDTVFDYMDLSSFYYRLWVKGDRYGRGVPLSGLIGNWETSLDKEIRSDALSKFGDLFKPEVRAKTDNLGLETVNMTLRLKNGNTITRSDLRNIYVVSHFARPPGNHMPSFSRFTHVSVEVVNKKGDLIPLVKYNANDREKIDSYLRGLFETFGNGINIRYIDNQLSV